MRTLFWVLFAAMAAVYLTMLFWSLPFLRDASGGLMPFDLRPGGYSPDEARVFLAALGDTGRDFYLHTQQMLDSAYPALLAVVLVMAFQRLFDGALKWVLSSVALLAAAFDYLENAGVAAMLRAGANGVSADMVAAASRWTVLKSATATIAITALLIGLALAGWRRWKRR